MSQHTPAHNVIVQIKIKLLGVTSADEPTLAGLAKPIQLLVGDESLPYFAQAAGRLAKRLGVEITSTAGTHFGYLDRIGLAGSAHGFHPLAPVSASS